MAISTTYHYTIDLDKGGLREVLRNPLYTLNSKAHTFALEIKQGSAAASLSSAKCKAYFIRADGVTVPIDGTVSGNVASVTLLPNCYAVQGYFELSVDLALGDVIHTILHVDGSILRTRTDSMTTGGSKVQSFDELVSAVQGVDAAMKRRDRVINLLDNSDFRNLVNQRGQTTYTSAGYTIDRWKTIGAGTVTPSANGVTIQATGGCQWTQPLPKDVNARYAGQPFTVALCLADGTVYIARGTIPAAGTDHDSAHVAIGSTGYKTNVYQQTRSYLQLRIFATAAQPAIALKWAALYIGSYTVDTLPEYQPKENELTTCRMFHRPIAANGFLGFAVRDADGYGFQGLVPGEPMRIEAPTIVGTIAAWDGVNSHTISEISAFVWTGNGYRIAGKTAAQGTPGETLAIHAVSDVAINADL